MDNKATILIVDDEPAILDVLKDMLELEGYSCMVANSAEQGIETLKLISADLVLSDIRMPQMDGIEFLGFVADSYPDTVRMALSGYSDKDRVLNAVNEGDIQGFFAKPWDSRELLCTISSALENKNTKAEQHQYVKNVEEQRDEAVSLFHALIDTASDGIVVLSEDAEITYFNKQAEVLFGYDRAEVLGKNMYVLLTHKEEVGGAAGMAEHVRNYIHAGEGRARSELVEGVACNKNGDEFPYELTRSTVRVGDRWNMMAIIRDVSQRKRAELERELHSKILHQSLTNTIRVIGKTMEKSDLITAGHQGRVAQLATAITGELGLSPQQIEGIALGATIHDIGQIYVPAEILNRPGKLTAVEFTIVKTHTVVGYDIVKDIDFPWPIAKMIHQHHERLDGSGYPDGLRGSEITFEAQIIAVADVVEAMSSHRPYRPALGIECAVKEIREQKGRLYNAEVVDACIKVIEEDNFSFMTPDYGP